VGHAKSSFRRKAVEKKKKPRVLRGLSAETEALHERAITLDILSMEVTQHPLPNQHEQPAARMVIVLVRSKVFRDLVDPTRLKGYLYLGAASVAGVPRVVTRCGCFRLLVQRLLHLFLDFFCSRTV